MQRSLFLFAFVFYELVGYLSNDMFLAGMMDISRDFSSTLDTVQLSIGIWLIGNGVAQVFLGPLCDHYGKKKILIYGGFVYVITLVGCVLSTSINIFLLLRFFQGMGVASIMVGGYAIIHESYNDREATRILAWTGTISILAPMLGPLLGSLVLKVYSWRAIFSFLFFPSLLCLLALHFALPARKNSIANIQLFRRFLSYGELFRNVSFISLALAYAFHVSTLILWITSSPYLLMKLCELDETSFALWQIPIFVALAFGANGIRLLERRFDYRQIIRLGQTFSIIGALLMFTTATIFDARAYLALTMLPISFGFGLLSPSLSRMAMTSTKMQQGLVTAGFFIVMDITAGVFSMVIGFLTDSWTNLALFIALASVMGAMLVGKAKRRVQ